MAMKLIDKVKVAGGEKANPTSLYELDRDLENEPDKAESAELVTAEHP